MRVEIIWLSSIEIDSFVDTLIYTDSKHYMKMQDQSIPDNYKHLLLKRRTDKLLLENKLIVDNKEPEEWK